MSIYFVQVILALLPSVFISSLVANKNHIKNILVPFIIGVMFGVFSLHIFKMAIKETDAKIFFDIICIVSLLCIPITIKLKNFYFLASVFICLGLGFGFDYSFISINFPLFSSELLDSVSLTSIFLMTLGFIVLICLYFLLTVSKKLLCKANFFIILFISIVVLVIDRLGYLILSLMQKGFLDTSTNLLSIVAKIVYFNNFLPYVYGLLILYEGIIYFYKKPSLVSRNKIIEYRKINQKRQIAYKVLSFSFLLVAVLFIFNMYFTFIASASPKISDPKIIEPVNGEFKLDVNELKDNKLHRYAYITDTGHEVRFFLLNRFKDKMAPIIVFDACSICGDTGYIKKGDELICISCNVRIFLPSVGKTGGCNPIPMDYKYDGKYITVSLKTIEDGAIYFSKIVEKLVIDPVSLKKIKNNSVYTYLYFGKTYFFENNNTQAEFEAHPEKYVTTDGKLLRNHK